MTLMASAGQLYIPQHFSSACESQTILTASFYSTAIPAKYSSHHESQIKMFSMLEPPLMRMPIEVRLMIYSLLLDDNGNCVLEFRNESHEAYKQRNATIRTCYNLLGRDLARQSRPTTYRCISNIEMHPPIMRVNRKIYAEAAHILYSSHSFSFGRDVEAIVPFFGDLTFYTRPLVQELSLVKQGSVYSRDYDRCEWTEVCNFLKDNMQLRNLKLVVEGGRPSKGWEGLPTYSAKEFATLSKVRHEHLEWVWQLLSIKGIQDLDVSAEIHYCPPSHSNAMAFFAAFSSSIEEGFTDFLRAELIKG